MADLDLIAENKYLENVYKEAIAMHTEYAIVSWQPTGLLMTAPMQWEDVKSKITPMAVENMEKGAAFVVVNAHYAVFRLTSASLAPKTVEALKAEVMALHSDLGDASTTVFDLVASLASKEAEIKAARDEVAKLDTRMQELNADLARAKAAL